MATNRPTDLDGLATDPEWRKALDVVPRELFVPTTAQATPVRDGARRWIDRDRDPDDWLAAVYSDTTILTQIDDGATALTEDTADRGTPSSSTSAPSLVLAFLDLLAVEPGDRVLEIGTGTGWTAALLSERLGAGHVTTVEIDQRVARFAAANLRHAGYAPRLVVGDGAKGWPRGAPYDGVHVTVGVRDIPYAWVEQTRTGGRIVLPWIPNPVMGFSLELRVDGDRAVGRLHGEAGYMPLRSERVETRNYPGEDRTRVAATDVHSLLRAGLGLRAMVAARMPNVAVSMFAFDDQIRLDDPATESRMFAEPLSEPLSEPLDEPVDEPGETAVRSIGPRDLWGELESAYRAWLEADEPGLERYGVTVNVSGQHMWLDHPDNTITGGFDG